MPAAVPAAVPAAAVPAALPAALPASVPVPVPIPAPTEPVALPAAAAMPVPAAAAASSVPRRPPTAAAAAASSEPLVDPEVEANAGKLFGGAFDLFWSGVATGATGGLLGGAVPAPLLGGVFVGVAVAATVCICLLRRCGLCRSKQRVVSYTNLLGEPSERAWDGGGGALGWLGGGGALMPTSCAVELGDNASIGGSIAGDDDHANLGGASWDDWDDDDAWSQSGPENPPSPDSPPAPRRMSGLDPWDDPPTRDWEESSRPPLVFPADDGGAAARDPTSGPLV